MDGETVDFVPDRSQLARVGPPPAPDVPAAAPPVWVAVLAVAAALGLSLSMALPPATRIQDGAVVRSTAIDDAPPRPSEMLQARVAADDK